MGRLVASYDEAIDYILGRINYERAAASTYSARDFKLDRMGRLLELLGNPQLDLPAVHITGTKGKGSTASMMSAVLSEAGYRVGLFTSPHIVRFEERIQVAGTQPSAAELIELVNEVGEAVEQLSSSSEVMCPTYFELATALAWMYFKKKGVEIAVLEVGLGGRLDSTNLCRPEVTVITNVSLDHTQILGDSHRDIAREKAGIVKEGVPLVSGVTHPEALEEIRRVCASQRAPLFQINDSFSMQIKSNNPAQRNHGSDSEEGHFEVVTPKETWTNLFVPLRGHHQQVNASIAVMAVECLIQRGWQVDDAAVRRGLQTVRCPLRVEVIAKQPTVILDVAHNSASVEALIKTLKSDFSDRQKILVFAATKDKDVRNMLELLQPCFERVILTQYINNPRAVPLSELKTIYEQMAIAPALLAETPQAAWKLAQTFASASDLICVTGSFFLAAEIRETVLTCVHAQQPETATPDGILSTADWQQNAIPEPSH